MEESVKITAKAIKGLNDITLKNEIVIFGSTRMSRFPLYELVNRCRLENAIYNRSIEKMTLDDALEIVNDCVIAVKPEKVFLAVGEEDENDRDAIKKYNALVHKIRTELPDCTLYLICLSDDSDYAADFNENIISLCDGKKIKSIRFALPDFSDANAYKIAFKQLSCFFRRNPINMTEAFDISDV